MLRICLKNSGFLYISLFFFTFIKFCLFCNFFRSSTSEQRNLIFEVFDRLSKLQNLVLGEVSGFYSLIFYPTAFLTVYLLTSTSRTAAARFWLFVLFGCSLALERFIVNLTVSDDSEYIPADEASVRWF